MKIRKNFRGFYWCDHLRTYEFDEINFKSKIILYFGNPKLKFLDKLSKRKKVYVDFEEPNRLAFYSSSSKNLDLWKGGNYDCQFDKIFSICPYTSEWFNDLNNNKKREAIFHPTNENLIYKKNNLKKDIDVIYTGNIHGLKKDILATMLEPITKFNYRIVSSFGDNKMVTDKNISNEKKFELIARSKISVIHQLLFPDRNLIEKFLKIKDIRKNKAFEHIDDGIIPQMKSRPFEAAWSKTLILIKKDPFNVIENYFEPNKHFLYFEEHELEKKIKYIINNYEDFRHITGAAYTHVKENYSRTKFLEKVSLSS